MLRTGRATPCWTARPTSTAAPCCSSSPPPTCTPATGRHSVSFVRPLIGHNTKPSYWPMMTDIRPSVCLQRGDSRSGHSSVRGHLWHHLLAGEASLQGKYHSYFVLHRDSFLLLPLFPPTFCVTQREEFSLLEEFSLGVFLLTESLTYFFLVSDC